MAASDNLELNMVESDEDKQVTIETDEEPVEKIRSQSPVKTKEKIKPVTINGAENTVFRTTELVLKVEYNGDIRKKILPNSEITYDELLRQIGRIFKCETLSGNEKLCVKYKDEDGDMVIFDTDEELQLAVSSGKTLNLKVDTATEEVKVSSSEIRKELLEMRNSIQNLLTKLDKSQLDISPMSKESSASQNLTNSVATVGLSELHKYVPTSKQYSIAAQPNESVPGNPNQVTAPSTKDPERKLNLYPTNENEKSGNMFPNGQSSSVNNQFIPQAPNMAAVSSPMLMSSASASGIFQQPGPGPASGTKNLPSMGNFEQYARPTSSLPSATITGTTPQVHPSAHQVYQPPPVHGNPINTYGVPFNPTSVQPPSTSLNNYFTPAPTAQAQNVSGYQAAPPTAQAQNVSGYQAAPPTAQAQNVSGYQAAPPMIRAPVAQAPPPLPNINHPGSVNPYARSTAPPRFGMQ